jgi:hypothetical protein
MHGCSQRSVRICRYANVTSGNASRQPFGAPIRCKHAAVLDVPLTRLNSQRAPEIFPSPPGGSGINGVFKAAGGRQPGSQAGGEEAASAERHDHDGGAGGGINAGARARWWWWMMMMDCDTMLC